MAPSTLESKMADALMARAKRASRRGLDPPSNVAGGPFDFTSGDYLSLCTSQRFRDSVLHALHKAPLGGMLGSGGSRLLLNPPAHVALEERCRSFFRAPDALLFGSGFDANLGFFACIPQSGDVVLHDEYIHASITDGLRLSRAWSSTYAFKHNSVSALGALCRKLLHERPELGVAGKKGGAVIVVVESVYSMEGTLAPLVAYCDLLEALFPAGNAHLVVDEAHATGIYGEHGRGLVCANGIEKRVFARLHTFGKSLAGSGGM
jgi:8-amino-7-oxononanoate synthase